MKTTLLMSSKSTVLNQNRAITEKLKLVDLMGQANFIKERRDAEYQRDKPMKIGEELDKVQERGLKMKCI